jgi:hypothetical protein
MKKYSKINSQPALKKTESNNQDYSNPITQIEPENELKNDYIYIIDPKKRNVIKTRNREKTDNLNNTLKMETKAFKIFEDALKEEKVDLLNIEKKSVKKKKIKKKKKSLKKYFTPDGELEKINSENNINFLEGETPTPNGHNNGVNNYYLINFQPKKKRSDYNITEIKQIISEEYYNTFHENDFEKNFKQLNSLEEPLSTIYQEKNKNYNYSVPSNASNKLAKSHYSERVDRKDRINPEKLSFNSLENLKEENNDENNEENDVKHNKLRRIKFRKKEINKENKMIDYFAHKIKENIKNKYLENNTSDDNTTDKDKEKNSKTPQTRKKKKRFMTKKKYTMNIISIIKIQSTWRKYKMRKIIELNKNLELLSDEFKSLMNKRLKSNLRFLFEKIKSIIIYANNNDNNVNNNKVNKVSKEKKKKKVKTKKIKMKNISGKNYNSSFEKEGSFKISEDDKISYDFSNDNSNDNSNNFNNNLKNNLEDDKKLFINNEEEEEKSTYPNNKDSNAYDSTSTENYYLLKDHNSSNNINSFNNNNIIKKVKGNIEGHQILGQINKDQLFKNVKIKSKLKIFKLPKKNKSENKDLSLSYDNLGKIKYVKPEVKPPNLKKKIKKSLNNSGNFNSIPLINNDYLNRSFSRNKFQNDTLINCHNDDLYYISNKRKMSYYKKIIGENPLSKIKPKKSNKIDISTIKFIIKAKETISKIVRKKFFYYLIGYLNAKSLLQNFINIFHKKKIALLKNSFNELKIKIQMKKLLDQVKSREKHPKSHIWKYLKICLYL